MVFEHPAWLVLGPLIVLLLSIWRYFSRLSLKVPFPIHQDGAANHHPTIQWLKDEWPSVLLMAGLISFFIALAGPYTLIANNEQSVQGVGIMVIMDLSSTMEAEDFLPGNRLSVSKRVLTTFISKRTQDLVGLVVFGTDAFLVSPLTLDHKRVIQQLQDVSVGSIEGMTAIGTALVKGANHLRKANLHSKVMILVTDGENNAGDIDPTTAAQLAAAVGIKVYTIGLGKVGGAPMPFIHPVLGKRYVRNPDGSLYLTKLDEGLLQRIASTTGGMYFRATDTESLYRITDYIDMLEKTKITTKHWEDRRSKRWPYIMGGLVLTLSYGLVHYILFRRWVA